MNGRSQAVLDSGRGPGPADSGCSRGVFHEKGFHGSSVDELGVRAGLSGPALYRHFGGKDDILAARYFDQRRLRYVTRWESLFAKRFPALAGIDPDAFVLGLLDRGFQGLA